MKLNRFVVLLVTLCSVSAVVVAVANYFCCLRAVAVVLRA